MLACPTPPLPCSGLRVPWPPGSCAGRSRPPAALGRTGPGLWLGSPVGGLGRGWSALGWRTLFGWRLEATGQAGPDVVPLLRLNWVLSWRKALAGWPQGQARRGEEHVSGTSGAGVLGGRAKPFLLRALPSPSSWASCLHLHPQCLRTQQANTMHRGPGPRFSTLAPARGPHQWSKARGHGLSRHMPGVSQL